MAEHPVEPPGTEADALRGGGGIRPRWQRVGTLRAWLPTGRADDDGQEVGSSPWTGNPDAGVDEQDILSELSDLSAKAFASGSPEAGPQRMPVAARDVRLDREKRRKRLERELGRQGFEIDPASLAGLSEDDEEAVMAILLLGA